MCLENVDNKLSLDSKLLVYILTIYDAGCCSMGSFHGPVWSQTSVLCINPYQIWLLRLVNKVLESAFMWVVRLLVISTPKAMYVLGGLMFTLSVVASNLKLGASFPRGLVGSI